MIRVLATLANPLWSAIEATQTSLFGALDENAFELHLACTARTRGASPSVFERAASLALPSASVFEADFGPSLNGATRAKASEFFRGAPRMPINVWRLARYVSSRGIDIIHSSQKPYDAVFGVLLAKLTGAKSVLHMHVKYGAWMTAPVKWALRNADLIVAVSEFTADALVNSELGIDPGRVRVIHNTLDTANWSPQAPNMKLRAELGIAADAPVLGCIGRLNEWKGHADLIEALPFVREKYPNVQLLIGGEEDPWSRGYKAGLEAKVSELGLMQNVRFLGYRSDSRDVHAAFDVFTFPTWEEPFGMVFLEAMAMQKPVVTIDSGAASEVVVHEETGLVVPPKDPVKLADSIVRLLKNPALRERMGRAGRARVAQVFNPARSAAILSDLYCDLVASSAPTAATGLAALFPRRAASEIQS